MARNEPSLVPEWLRQGQGSGPHTQAHHRYHGDGGGPTTPRRYPGRDSEPSPWSSGSYVPPGRRNGGGERPPYERPYSTRGPRSSEERSEYQGGGGQEKLAPEPKPRRQGGGEDEASGPSLPTAMPTTTGSLASNVQKAVFERNFPTLGDRFGRFMSPSDSLPSPRNRPSLNGAENWTSRLADLPSPTLRGGPAEAGVNGGPRASEVQERTPKMSEAVQQAMQEQQQRLAPQTSLDGQKQEELVLKKMKQLIPLRPSMPKNLLLKPSKKPVAPSPSQPGASDPKLVVRRSEDASAGAPRRALNGSVMEGRLHGVSSGLTQAAPMSPVGNGSVSTVTVPKPSAASQKRNDFFKALRKKAVSPKERAPEGDERAEQEVSKEGAKDQFSNNEKAPMPSEVAQRPDEAPSIRSSNGPLTNGHVNGVETKAEEKRVHEVEPVAEPDQEEAAFLRSLGWTSPDDDDQEGALTEEEIRSFFSQTAKLTLESKASYQNGVQTYKPSSPIHVAASPLSGTPSKGEPIVGSYSSLSSGLSSSDDESDY